MAQRRMFSPEIVCSEEFLEMPPSSRELYFQLAIRADDDGFIQPKGVLRLTGATTDDLKILLGKRFILPFESGVVVIKHWLIHNMIRLDRYKETRFLEEKKQLFIKENKAYTEDSTKGTPLATKWQPNGNLPAPQVRLGKDSNTSVAIAPPLVREKEDAIPPKEESPFKDGFEGGYLELCSWAEKRRGAKFLSNGKQFKALARARRNEIGPVALKKRWQELENDDWRDGLDWASVVSSFDKRPVGK